MAPLLGEDRMRRPPIGLPLFLTGLMLAASLVATAATAQSRRSAPPRVPPAAAAPADADEDSPAAALTACERRAQGRLRVWDRLGDAAVSATRGIGHFVGASDASVASVLRFGHSLSERVQRQLNCHEQQQAEVATARAINGGVGTTRSWRSGTRANVSGSSTVVAADRGAEGDCLTVTDVVIVDGQETRAPKHMCRRPPSNRYVRV
jgi:surface antigen